MAYKKGKVAEMRRKVAYLMDEFVKTDAAIKDAGLISAKVYSEECLLMFQRLEAGIGNLELALPRT